MEDNGDGAVIWTSSVIATKHNAITIAGKTFHATLKQERAPILRNHILTRAHARGIYLRGDIFIVIQIWQGFPIVKIMEAQDIFSSVIFSIFTLQNM